MELLATSVSFSPFYTFISVFSCCSWQFPFRSFTVPIPALGILLFLKIHRDLLICYRELFA